MKKIFSMLVLIMFQASIVMAQTNNKYSIKGSIIDKETGEPVVGATVQLLSLPDSSFVSGAINFSPIIEKLEGHAKNDSKITPLLNLLKKLSKEKPQNASQFINITNGFDPKELNEALNKIVSLWFDR